jgi:L-threonylcarbamoyladenylate synthase
LTPLRVDAASDAALDAAQEALARGALIVYPTDTLYAIGGRALDPRAATAVRRAKGRAEGSPLPLVAADLEQVQQITADTPAALTRLCVLFWPGPLTLVLPSADVVPDGVTSGTKSVAVRVPASDLARRLCRGVGPLIATSANLSGGPPAATCAEAVQAVGSHVALAIDGGPAVQSRPSTIVDLTGDAPRLVRAGAVEWQSVLSALSGGRHSR